MGAMNQDVDPSRAEWKYGWFLISLMVGMLAQSLFLPCLCYAGTMRMYFAGVVDLLVVLRLIIARVRRERGKGWIFYAMLPYLIIPVALLIFQ